MGIYQMIVMSWCTENVQIRSKSNPNGFARISDQKFYFESDRIGMVASHSVRIGCRVPIWKETKSPIHHKNGVSGQAAQPVPLASLKLGITVYGQKLDGRPSR